MRRRLNSHLLNSHLAAAGGGCYSAPPLSARPPIASDPTLRLAAYLACLFAGTGVLLPFLPQWLSETRGLSGAEIALVISTPALVRIVIGPMLGAWADGFKDRRTPLAVFAGLAVFAYAAFALADTFWALFVTSIIAGSLTGAAARNILTATAARSGSVLTAVQGAASVRYWFPSTQSWRRA